MRRKRLNNNSRVFRFGLAAVCFCLAGPASAQTQIHKCTDANGGVVYSQLPCVSQKAEESEKTEPEAKVESEPPASAMREPPESEAPDGEPELETSKSACKKRYRDAIDVIDAEINLDYTPEKAEQYKQRLLVLTRELRQC